MLDILKEIREKLIKIEISLDNIKNAEKVKEQLTGDKLGGDTDTEDSINSLEE